MEPIDKRQYATAGKTVYDKKKIRKGKTGAHSSSIPSIPTNYQTVINETEPFESGFGKTSRRFTPRKIEDTPGPGNYYNYQTPEIKSDSFSKKGMGNGFVSKSDRFSNDIDGRKANFSMEPGPAHYQFENSNTLVPIHKKDFSKAATSSSFSNSLKENISRKSQISSEATSPGPGSYDALLSPSSDSNSSTSGSGSGSGSASFLSQTKRTFDKLENTSNVLPPPGQYNPEDGKNKNPIENRYASSFQSKSSRIAFHQNIQTDLPGPGDYNAQYNELPKKKSTIIPPDKSKSTNLYAVHTEVRAPHVDNPGPGYYNYSTSSVNLNYNTGNSFKSSMPRSLPLPKTSIGPGDYDPVYVSEKESFHYSTRKNWV